MSKETIAFILPGLGSGGAERVVTILANQFTEKYRVIIITLYKSNPFYPLNQEIEVFYCHPTPPVSKNWIQAVSSNYRLLSRISKLIKEHRVALTIGFLTTANVLAILAAKLNRIPVVVSERNNPSVVRAPAFWRVFRKLTYPKSDFLVVQTEAVKQYYSDIVDLKKLVVIPNPIDPELTSRKEQPLNRQKIILNVGRLTDQKAQHILIKAFAELESSDWQLHIVGKGRKEMEYRKLISALSLDERVKILPPTEQIEAHYKTASIFAFVSVYEGFPNALVEAMHFGLPCISTNCPSGPSDLISNGENGFLIPVGDQNALKSHLSALMRDESLRKRVGGQGEIDVKRLETAEIALQWNVVLKNCLQKNVNESDFGEF